MIHKAGVMDLFEIVTFSIYITAASFSLIAFVLFIWWWWKRKSATKAFAYVTILFFALALEMGIEAIGFYYYSIEHAYTLSIVRSYIWPLKTLFVTFIMFTIVVNVTSRIYNQMKMAKMFKKRRSAIADDVFREEVIIVDDHKEITDMISVALKRVFPNIKVFVAFTGEEAVRILHKEKNINLVITDILLPKMSGFDICKTIKGECPWTIVIGMTGYLSIYEFWAAREVGFDDYIQKPFAVSEIIDLTRNEFKRLNRWKSVRTSKEKQRRKR